MCLRKCLVPWTCKQRIAMFVWFGCCCGWSHSGVSLNVLVHVPAVAHVSTGVMTFSCFSLGKNVKHHSLDKEPSILYICFKVSKSPFFPMREKNLEKNVVGLWNCIAMWALLDQVFWFPLGRKLLLLYWGASVSMPNPFPCWECGCCSFVLRANVSIFGQYFMPRQCQR